MSSTDWLSLIVLAKAPVPGRAKTRLSPPCSHEQAATIAAAALADTLEVVVALAGVAARPILVLDGEPGPWLPFGIPVVPQRGCGLDERLAAAFEDVGGPALLIGMDTPQVSTRLLAACLTRLAVPEVSAVLGPAVDGGFWAVGLKVPDAAAFLGVPMSTEYTGMAQRARLGGLGLTVASLPVLGDVDVWEDAISVPVARESRFAAAVARVRLEIALDSRSEDRRR